MTSDHTGTSSPTPLPPLEVPPGVHWVDTPEALHLLVECVRTVREQHGDTFRCCLDTEADSLHHYQEKLCLIQLAFGDHFALIDPLAVPDVLPLLEVLNEGEVWFHGADYDLTLLRRTYGWTPTRLRDTQIAARLTGSRQFGLAALIEKHFDKKISKASQKADWSRRPLSPTMLSYAVDDVRHLLEIADNYQTELQAKDRMSWFIQSCDDLRDGVASRSTAKKEDPWRLQGSGKLHPKGLALLRELWLWREGIAEERDVPCFRIISNKQLIEAATQFEGGRIPNPPAGWRPKWKRDFIAAIELIVNGNEATFPQRVRLFGTRMTDAAREQLDVLCQHREELAKELDLEPSLLGARAALEQVVGRADGIDELLPWQREVLGEKLAKTRTLLGFDAVGVAADKV